MALESRRRVDTLAPAHVRSRTHDGGRKKAEDRSQVTAAEDGRPRGSDASAPRDRQHAGPLDGPSNAPRRVADAHATFFGAATPRNVEAARARASGCARSVEPPGGRRPALQSLARSGGSGNGAAATHRGR